MERFTRALTFGLAAAALAIVAGASAPASTVEAAADPELTATLDRVGNKVLEYYQRAQTIVATENVRMQPLGDGMTPSGPPRRLAYDFRLEWSLPDRSKRPEPNVVRKLISVNGSDAGPADHPECEDPRAESPEPLFMLIPERRREFGFSLGKPQRMDGRVVTVVDYFSLPVGSTQPTWNKDCVSIPLEGKTRGRILIDAETDTVIRLEEHLVGVVEVRVPRDYARGNQTWMQLDRADFTVRYEPVRFSDPDETMVLPASIETLRIFRGSGVSRVRTTQTFAGYQRFLTNSRMIPLDAITP